MLSLKDELSVSIYINIVLYDTKHCMLHIHV